MAWVRPCRIGGWVAVRFHSLTHPRRRLLRIHPVDGYAPMAVPGVTGEANGPGVGSYGVGVPATQAPPAARVAHAAVSSAQVGPSATVATPGGTGRQR